MATEIPRSLGRLLLDSEEYQDIYTLEQVNALLTRLPQAIRAAAHKKLEAYELYQKAKLATKMKKCELRVKTSKNWKETFSSSKDRDAYVDSHEEVQALEKAEIEAEVRFKELEAQQEQLDNNYTALKKIYQTFADDNKIIERMQV